MPPGVETGARRATAPVLSAVLFLGCAFVLTLLLTRSLVTQSDEGYTLNAAWQLWNGLRMYDDFRLFVGPGSGYAVFLLWKVVGSPSYLAARWLSVGFGFSSTIALFMLLRRLRIGGLNLAFTVVIWLLVSSLYVPLNHNSFSSYAALWFLLPFMRLTDSGEQEDEGEGNGDDRPIGTVRRRMMGDAALSGLAAGVAFLILPPKGGLLAAVALVWLFALRKRSYRPALVFLSAFLLTMAPVVLRWGPATLIRQWLVIPVTGNYLGHTSASGKFTVVAVVLVAGLLAAAFRLRDRPLKTLAAVQAALFASMSHNMELNHFAINVFPTVIFLSLVVRRRLAERAPQTSREGLGFSPALALASVTGALLAWTAFTSAGAEFLTTSALKADLLRHQPTAFGNPRIAAAHAIYAGPFLPGLYYLLKKNNPFFVSETIVCNDDCQRQLVAQLSQVKPELAFLDYDMVAHLDYPLTGPVDVYLREHYTACPGKGDIAVRAIAPGWCP
jgi:hypothetical protein